MLGSANDLKNSFLSLPPTNDMAQGIQNFVDTIASFVNDVQAGPNGAPGIFTLNRPAMIAVLSSLQAVSDQSWVNPFSDALEAGIIGATIVPSTVTDPATWIGSVTDVATVPSAAATITTISQAKTTFKNALQNVTASNNPPMPLAQGVSDATLEFIFTCIGLGPPIVFLPIPVQIPAQ